MRKQVQTNEQELYTHHTSQNARIEKMHGQRTSCVITTTLPIDSLQSSLVRGRQTWKEGGNVYLPTYLRKAICAKARPPQS